MRQILLVLVNICLSAVSSLASDQNRPNVIFILTDNQGAWTLGCYGNPDIRTPHIDKLAREGTRFARALSSNPVCSPTRATFLTGLMPSQHGIHTPVDPKYMMGPEAYNCLDEFTTLGEILRDAGYSCGLSGKWHLGDNLRASEGFSYWSTKPEGSTREFYNQNVIEDGQLRVEAGYTTDLWTRRGIEFIEANQQRPFFLYLSYNGPYVLGPMMLNESKNRHVDTYRDHHFKSFPVDAMHPWQYHNKQFHNQQIAMERTACEVAGVDDGVGQIMATLERLKLDKKTLVVYASDQGWMGGQNGIWGMGDHTSPAGAHELMMQIPFLFWQPGKIKGNHTSDALVSNYDFLPTLLGCLDLKDRLPRSQHQSDLSPSLPAFGEETGKGDGNRVKANSKFLPSPGRDFSPILRGEDFIDTEQATFYEFETVRAIRTEAWKYVSRIPDGPNELYDMNRDRQERFNLFGQSGTQAIQKQLEKRLQTFFERYSDPQYDLCNGGYSKTRRHSLR